MEGNVRILIIKAARWKSVNSEDPFQIKSPKSLFIFPFFDSQIKSFMSLPLFPLQYCEEPQIYGSIWIKQRKVESKTTKNLKNNGLTS